MLEVRRENGHEEPWTWVRTYGKGRVFYTAWGHDQRTWGQVGFQKLVEQGTWVRAIIQVEATCMLGAAEMPWPKPKSPAW